MTTEPNTKLQETIGGAKTLAKDMVNEFKLECKLNPVSRGVRFTIDDILNSSSVVWFCAGVAVEAAGIAAQMIFRIESIPLMDAIVGSLLAIGLYYYQKKHVTGDVECSKDSE